MKLSVYACIDDSLTHLEVKDQIWVDTDHLSITKVVDVV